MTCKVNINIVRYTPDDHEAKERFNERMRQAGETYALRDEFINSMFSEEANNKLFQEFFVAKDEDGEIRGGYYLKHQEFWIQGHRVEIADLQYPLSEGVINPEYLHVGPQVLQDAGKRMKFLFGLGMGGFDQPLPKIFRRMGWHLYEVPFYYYILNGKHFIRDFAYLKKIRSSSKLINFVIGFAEVFQLVRIFTFVNRLYLLLFSAFSYGIRTPQELLNVFDERADQLWEQYKSCYSMVARRDSLVLNSLYPENDNRFHRILFKENDVAVGWVLLMNTRMNNDKYFGNLTVGTLVDHFCAPEKFHLLTQLSIKFLKSKGADLIVCNHSNEKCGRALRRTGFLKGPSNFILAVSRNFSSFFDKGVDFRNSFFMRGDGDGPINL